MEQIGLGGSCYWCTEAIFCSLTGVKNVQQGWLNSFDDQAWFSEGILLQFDTQLIRLDELIEIHLNTHSATSNHSRRDKYRSAVYCESMAKIEEAKSIIARLQDDFDKAIITQPLLLNEFSLSPEQYQNYYYSDPTKPFCQNQITPKLLKLIEQFNDKVDHKIINKALDK
ncbi:peptide-methionine (S)-S-oxide reductase [Pseudoalteromonas luteoviolacea]|nr:peptide-methionine (S)-S-oxide reductase [Pseudoalteromonas luteoviolacea]MBQ4838513.1 peptide-methionine (S)-S-oxide reductase [Pseudoalteromonas luteoviolacea]